MKIKEIFTLSAEQFLIDNINYVLAEITRVDGFYFVRIVKTNGDDILLPMDIIEKIIRIN